MIKMFWDKWKQESEDIRDILFDLDKEIKAIKTEITILKERRDLSADIGARVAELELKMSKLWSMLIETSSTGKEKLTRFGRRFGSGFKAGNR